MLRPARQPPETGSVATVAQRRSSNVGDLSRADQEGNISEINKALVRRYLREVVEEVSEAAVDELVAEDIVLHEPEPPGVLRGISAYKEFWRQFKNLGDTRVEILDLVAEGDKVFARFNVSALIEGRFFGLDPSAEPEEWHHQEMSIYRFRDGQLAESWTGVGAPGLWAE